MLRRIKSGIGVDQMSLLRSVAQTFDEGICFTLDPLCLETSRGRHILVVEVGPEVPIPDQLRLMEELVLLGLGRAEVRFCPDNDQSLERLKGLGSYNEQPDEIREHGLLVDLWKLRQYMLTQARLPVLV